MSPAADAGLSHRRARLSVARLSQGASFSHSQPQITPLGLDRVSCADTTHCIAVGSNGTAAITSDGGGSWLMEATGSNQLLFGVDCVTDLSCWTSGENGTILATADGGHTWRSETSGTTQFLYAISCPTTSTCWAAGDQGTVVTTADGGQTWSAQSTGIDLTFFGLDCPTTSACIGVDNAGIEVTTDGGQIWAAPSVGIPEGFFGVSCATSLECWVVGSGGSIAVTSDGGSTWRVQQDADANTALNFQYNDALWAISCPTATDCVTVGGGVSFEATTDGGSTWTTSTVPAADLYFGLSCPAPSTCIATGSDSNIVETTDGGGSWVRQVVPASPTGNPVKVAMVGDSTSFTLGLGLAAQSNWYGVSIADDAILGCGVAEGEPLTFYGQQVPVAAPCNGDLSSSNPQIPQVWALDVALQRPQVVVLLAGRFEVCDRLHNGVTMNITEPAFQNYLVAQLTEAAEVLTSTGAHLVFLTAPYYSEGGPPSGGIWDQDDPARVNVYNSLLYEVAARYPGRVSVIDLNAKVDPGGVYSAEVDGVQVRNPDGVHFQLSGGEWLAPWLLPQLTADAPSSLTPPGGLWTVATNGAITASGTAANYGSMGGKPLDKPIVGMAATADGAGYWEVASDGGIFTFGDAGFYGSMGGTPLSAPVVGMAANPSTGGYALVTGSGQVATYDPDGTNTFAGPPGNSLPIAGMAVADGGFGYWVTNIAGQSFASGSAPPLSSPPSSSWVVGVVASP